MPSFERRSALADADLRTHYVASLARSWPIAALAETLDAVCERAEQAEVDVAGSAHRDRRRAQRRGDG